MSGQVFRWEEVGEDRLLGVDGDDWYLVKTLKPETYAIKTNASEESFRKLFRLDEPLNEYRKKIVAQAPEMKKYFDQLPGLRVMRPTDAVEEMFCFLCTANNNLKRILSMVRKLAEKGRVMDEVEGNKIHRFPDVEEIANIDEQELRDQGFGYRGRTIPAVARQVMDRGGREWLENLRKRPYEEARKKLIELDGVGPKLADCICLFALHHTSAVPVDTHLWQASVRLYFPEWKGKSLTDKRYMAVADHCRDRFGALAGWAHQYLFYDNLLNWRTYRKG
ncbi:MAG: hypothetical protein IIC73_03035 [Armatimonadetes bacterium]|nr:hypothetical protein [Armatimonadota bacterium]